VRVPRVAVPVAMTTVPFSCPPPGPRIPSMSRPSTMIMSLRNIAVSNGFRMRDVV
jgi:hypothetical protein